MNCFEARNGFAGFWRKTLEPEVRAAFLAHLQDCAGCDRAFRVFAMTAPLLYADTIPARRAAPSGPRAIRPASAIRRAGNSRRGLGALCAMVAAMVAAGFAAYLSAAMPRQTLEDALSNSSETTSDLAGQEETLVSLNDFAR
jgi:hypothetical protein